MIDYIVIKGYTKSPLTLGGSHNPVNLFGLTFTPVYDKHQPIVKYYTTFYRNLKVQINGIGVVRISNSLLKFSNGNNYSNCSFNTLKETINHLVKKFELDLEHTKVSKFEFGVNLHLDIPVDSFLNSLVSYKNRELNKMTTSSGQLYGYKAELSQYSVKFYDKAAEVKIHSKGREIIQGNILRIELVRKSLPILNDYRLLKDFLDESKINNLFGELIRMVYRFKISSDFKLIDITPRQRELLFAGLNKSFWSNERSLNKNTYKSKRSLFTKLFRKTINTKVKSKLMAKIAKEKRAFTTCSIS